ncbi:MAG: hypothetical protein ACRDK1_00350 [Solirubrobacterales bacterium]
MLGTYGSLVVVLAASCVVGQAVFALCGARRWSWLAPAVGLAVLIAVAWGAIRLPGRATASVVAIGALCAASLALLGWRRPRSGEGVGSGLAAAAVAVLGGSIPFIVEGRFGILGTGLNPDMSQHLFAADALSNGSGGRLLEQGYPLGPHALVAAVSKLTGCGLVHGFDALMLATVTCAALAPLALLGGLAGWRRVACAALVALPYMAASYLIQGAFKETLEALFALAFAIGLHEIGRRSLIGPGGPAPGARRAGILVAVPLSALAVGAVYAYSFPGLLWPIGAAVLWGAVELSIAARRGGGGAAVALARRSAAPALVAVAVLCAAVAPELGRMIDFASFETFDPSGPGLGNLFNPISPLEALGIWPSGDFRLDPGDGAVPAAIFHLGELLGLVALAYGLVWWLGRRLRAVPSALAVATGLFAYAHFTGTPYQAAKSIVIAAPLAMLISARALIGGEPLIELGGLRGAVARRRGGLVGALARHQSLLGAVLAIAFVGAAAGSSLLALANGPVGPGTYSPALADLRGRLGGGSTLVLAPATMLADEHGRDYLVWELRGGRVCVAAQGPPVGSKPPAGVAHVITQGTGRAPFGGLRLVRRAGMYSVWETRPAPAGPGPCPLIAVGGRADPAAGR